MNLTNKVWIGGILLLVIAAGIFIPVSDYRYMLSSNPEASYILLDREDYVEVITRSLDNFIRWKFTEDENTIYLGRFKGAVEKWYVEYKRVYLPKNQVQNLSDCSHITPTRCYVDDYYERLWRKASLIKIDYINDSNSVTVRKETPYYGYGKRSGSGGTLQQFSLINDDASYINFPSEYTVKFTPSSSRTYSTNRLIWHIEKLPVEENYKGKKDCLLSFKNDIKINLCNSFDLVDFYELKDADNVLEIYFKPQVGEQELDLRLYDPPTQSVPILNSTFGTNLTHENLTLYNQTTVAATTNIIRWLLNGSNLQALNLPFDTNYSNHSLRNEIKDYSGNGNNGTGGNGSVSFTPHWNGSGHEGGGYDFDGINDSITIGDTDDLSFTTGSVDKPFSITAWINMKDATGFRIFSKGENTVAGREYFLGTNGTGNLSFTLTASNWNIWILAESTIDLCAYENQWVHIASTYNGSATAESLTLYLNGEELSSIKTMKGVYSYMRNRANDAFVGRYFNSTLYANGSIDNLVVWNRELSAEQVNTLYLNGTNKILSQETAVDEVWQGCVTPNNASEEEGSESCSKNLTIIAGYQNFTTSYPPGVTEFNITATSWYGWFTPQGQNKTYGVFNVTNNGASLIDISFRLNKSLPDGVTLCMDNDSAKRGCQNITNSSGTRLWNGLGLSNSQQFWAWSFLNYPETTNITYIINISINGTLT